MTEPDASDFERIAKRLALDLECMLLHPDAWWKQAHATLEEYRQLVDKHYPQDHVSPLGKD